MQDISKKKTKITCWVVTEGIAGTENQCLGVCEALGVHPDIKRISLKQPWKTLSPYLNFVFKSTFEPKLEPPWPDLLITSGRKGIPASQYIKRKSRGKTFTVHIQDPRINPKHFDLVALPAHDPTRGENVLVTTAAPNRITQERLDEARTQFPFFSHMPEPRIAVLIGGYSKAYKLTLGVMTRLTEQLRALSGQLMITTSRRTGAENERILKKELMNTKAWIWDGQTPNPYFAMLAWADYILVTSDSASMLSEAATTGKPVYMIPLEGGGRRIDKLHENLIESGAVRVFDGTLEHWNYEPLRDADKIAAEIRSRLKTL